MESSAKELVPKFFDNTASSYETIVNRTTFGKDQFWKKEILKKIPECTSVLDLACGTGILTRKISENLPNAKITGIDITQNYLNVAKIKSKSYKNIQFFLQDAEKMSLGSKFDCITSSYIPKYCDPKILLKKCMEHLNPGGRIIFHDFTYPANLTMRIFWDLYFVVLKTIGFFIPSWNSVFKELPNLIRSTKWLDDYESEMKKNNLSVSRQNLTCGTSAILTGIDMV